MNSIFDIVRTGVFQRWLNRLRDRQAQARIEIRIRRLAEGNPGQVRDVGYGVSEAKIDFGPGYRLYYKHRDRTVILLLCGGDKNSQQRDIALAHQLAKQLS